MNIAQLNTALGMLYANARRIDKTQEQFLIEGQQILEAIIPQPMRAEEIVSLAQRLQPRITYNHCSSGQPFVVTVKEEKTISQDQHEKALEFAAGSTGFGREVVERAIEAYDQYFAKESR